MWDIIKFTLKAGISFFIVSLFFVFWGGGGSVEAIKMTCVFSSGVLVYISTLTLLGV